PPPPSGPLLIIGGGASGALLAWNLLARQAFDGPVTLVEPRARLGLGVAYGDARSFHLLNVPAGAMGIDPDDPGDFLDWLRRRPAEGRWADLATTTADAFVPRAAFGDYLSSRLDPFLAEGRLRHRRARVVDLQRAPGRGAWVATLDDGTTERGGRVVLALGNNQSAPIRVRSDDGCVPGLHETPWLAPKRLPADASVLILGTGLTMVDVVIALAEDGHRGPIHALSRRGRLPLPQVSGLPKQPVKLPLGADSLGIAGLLHHIKAQARAEVAAGGDWRSVMDGLRAPSKALWPLLAETDKRRFLRHLLPRWNLLRHRLPPVSLERIETLRQSGALTLHAGRLRDVRRDTDGLFHVLYQDRAEGLRPLCVDVILNCTGSCPEGRFTANPLLATLFEKGQVALGPAGLGVAVTAQGQVLSAGGRTYRTLFALGPLVRGAQWECTAIPDIRQDAAALAATLGQTATVSA
ncbi:FAD/NAD(P)-binding protein, partial [Rhodospirillum rubrum]